MCREETKGVLDEKRMSTYLLFPSVTVVTVVTVRQESPYRELHRGVCGITITTITAVTPSVLVAWPGSSPGRLSLCWTAWSENP